MGGGSSASGSLLGSDSAGFAASSSHGKFDYVGMGVEGGLEAIGGSSASYGSDPIGEIIAANPPDDGPEIVVTARRPSDGSNATSNYINFTNNDIHNLKKVVQSEAGRWPGSMLAKGVVDTILNRWASGHWGSTLDGVVNSYKQFSEINGPVGWKEGWNSVEGYPDSRVTQATSDFVDSYLSDRAAGAPSSVGNNLNYANPNFSSRSNLPWIMALDGPVYGTGNSSQRYGTVPSLQQYRPQPYTIVLPQNR
jgi:hypothetical protein